jgi:DinB superfamily
VAIRRMVEVRRATIGFLSQLSEEELVRRRTRGQWSIKDVLAHIAAWEQEGAHRLELIAQGFGERIHFYHDPREIDRFNARAVSAARRMPLGAVLRRLARARRRLTDALHALPPRALRDPSHEIPVVSWLPEFAWTHEQDHFREIRAWWKTQSEVKRVDSRRPRPADRRSRLAYHNRRRSGGR